MKKKCKRCLEVVTGTHFCVRLRRDIPFDDDDFLEVIAEAIVDEPKEEADGTTPETPSEVDEEPQNGLKEEAEAVTPKPIDYDTVHDDGGSDDSGSSDD